MKYQTAFSEWMERYSEMYGEGTLEE